MKVILKKVEKYVRTVAIIIEKKYNTNTFFRNDNDKEKGKVVNSVKNTNNNRKKTKVVDLVNKTNNQTLINGFLNCSKTYLMNHILLQKQELIYIYNHKITESKS